jgi:protocatechuate 3,4-dioxygenase beta subunit
VQPTAFTATSDDAGKFTIENIDPGKSYNLTAQRTGFVTARYGARSATSPPVPLSLDAGQVMKGVSLIMVPQGVITGRITDPNGDPIQGARAVLLRRGYQRGVRQLVPGNTASTNDQGDFRIANLQPGRYYVMVQSNPTSILTSGGAAPKNAPIATYYPNATDALGAAPLDIAAGQELRGIDVRMREGRVFTVRGKAVGINGGPVAGANIIAAPKGSSDALQILSLLTVSIGGQNQTKPDGSFELRGLTPGAYTLSSIATGGNIRTTGRTEINVVDADLADVVFSITPGPSVTGTIRLDGGDIKSLLPATDPNATAQSLALSASAANAGIAVSGARLAVALGDLNPLPIGGTQPGIVKDDGTFVIENVAPAKYQLNVAALPQGMYVKSAKLSGADVTLSPVDLTAGAGGNLDIVISNKAADITGAVRSDKNDSMIGVTVSLWTRDPEPGTAANGVRTVTTDQTGAFQFKGLRPGTYYAAAWEDIDTGLAQARDFLSQLTSEATKLELAEGAHSAAEVKLVPTAKIKAAEEKLP